MVASAAASAAAPAAASAAAPAAAPAVSMASLTPTLNISMQAESAFFPVPSSLRNMVATNSTQKSTCFFFVTFAASLHTSFMNAMNSLRSVLPSFLRSFAKTIAPTPILRALSILPKSLLIAASSSSTYGMLICLTMQSKQARRSSVSMPESTVAASTRPTPFVFKPVLPGDHGSLDIIFLIFSRSAAETVWVVEVEPVVDMMVTNGGVDIFFYIDAGCDGGEVGGGGGGCIHLCI